MRETATEAWHTAAVGTWTGWQDCLGLSIGLAVCTVLPKERFTCKQHVVPLHINGTHFCLLLWDPPSSPLSCGWLKCHSAPWQHKAYSKRNYHVWIAMGKHPCHSYPLLLDNPELIGNLMGSCYFCSVFLGTCWSGDFQLSCLYGCYTGNRQASILPRDRGEILKLVCGPDGCDRPNWAWKFQVTNHSPPLLINLNRELIGIDRTTWNNMSAASLELLGIFLQLLLQCSLGKVLKV